jgi:hypothetical protein
MEASACGVVAGCDGVVAVLYWYYRIDNLVVLEKNIGKCQPDTPQVETTFSHTRGTSTLISRAGWIDQLVTLIASAQLLAAASRTVPALSRHHSPHGICFCLPGLDNKSVDLK